MPNLSKSHLSEFIDRAYNLVTEVVWKINPFRYQPPLPDSLKPMSESTYKEYWKTYFMGIHSGLTPKDARRVVTLKLPPELEGLPSDKKEAIYSSYFSQVQQRLLKEESDSLENSSITLCVKL
jgi:hypothetical protein